MGVVSSHFCLGAYVITMLTEQAIQEFKDAYLKELGTSVDDSRALDLAQSLLNIYRVIYRPLPDSEQNNIKNRPVGESEKDFYHSQNSCTAE